MKKVFVLTFFLFQVFVCLSQTIMYTQRDITMVGGPAGITNIVDASDVDTIGVSEGSTFVWSKGKFVPKKEGIIKHASDYTNSTTTFTTIPDYSFDGAAGESYWFEYVFRVAGNSTSDSRWRVVGSDGWFAVSSVENATSKAPVIGSSSGNINLTNSTLTTGDEITIRGIAEFTSAGAVAIQARLNSGSNTLTVYGGKLKYEKFY